MLKPATSKSESGDRQRTSRTTTNVTSSPPRISFARRRSLTGVAAGRLKSPRENIPRCSHSLDGYAERRSDVRPGGHARHAANVVEPGRQASTGEVGAVPPEGLDLVHSSEKLLGHDLRPATNVRAPVDIAQVIDDVHVQQAAARASERHRIEADVPRGHRNGHRVVDEERRLVD